MRGRSIAVIGSIALLAIFLAYTSFLTIAPTPLAQSSHSLLTSTTGSGSSTTLEDLVAGKFPTAADKRGTGGVTVTVHDLRVLYVRTESDGDWHVGVTDGTIAIFITEIIPADQQTEGMPPVGSTIDETGMPYCDTAHETESWHGNTCWEIHPIRAWSISSPGNTSSGTTGTQTVAADYSVGIVYDQNPIARGSTQTITVRVSDSDGAARGVAASIEVDYASGLTIRNFSCTTSADGECSISWEIGPTSTPGSFNVLVEVNGQDFTSSFSVTD